MSSIYGAGITVTGILEPNFVTCPVKYLNKLLWADGVKRVTLSRDEFAAIFEKVDAFGENTLLQLCLLDEIFGKEAGE